MKKLNNKRRKQGPIPPEIIRHYEMLSPKETDEVVDSVSGLIVNFVKKGRPKSGIANPGEASNQDPDSRKRRG